MSSTVVGGLRRSDVVDHAAATGKFVMCIDATAVRVASFESVSSS